MEDFKQEQQGWKIPFDCGVAVSSEPSHTLELQITKSWFKEDVCLTPGCTLSSGEDRLSEDS